MCLIFMSMEWTAIEKAYAIKQDERSRDEVLTDQERSLNDASANFVSEVLEDLQLVFSHSNTPTGLLFAIFSVLTKGDRGIIFGTILIIVSLSLLTLHHPNETANA